jgi:hypothetical protein
MSKRSIIVLIYDYHKLLHLMLKQWNLLQQNLRDATNYKRNSLHTKMASWITHALCKWFTGKFGT